VERSIGEIKDRIKQCHNNQCCGKRSNASAGLEWRAVFAVKWIEPLLWSSYKPDDELFEGHPAVAIMADARLRGKSLLAEDNVCEYLPTWLLQNGINMEEDMAPLEACYELVKDKQHREV
jgi:hypothetical protein